MDNYEKEVVTQFLDNMLVEMKNVTGKPPTKMEMRAHIESWVSTIENIKFIIKQN